MKHDLTRRLLLINGTAALATVATGAAPALAQSWGDRLRGLFGGDGGSLTETQATQGLREALRVGAERVVTQVGAPDGYLKDAAIHIPLPGWLDQTRRVLTLAGASGMLDDLETRLNRGAELAASKATPIFVDAITAMTVTDAVGIIKGPDNAATAYFQETMTPRLKEEFRPVVETQLREAGAIQSFNQVTARYNQAPLVQDIGAGALTQLIDHGLDGALGGIFHYLGKEEAAIRDNPAARTTQVLKDVFG